jgi:hypothetical protein
VEIIFEDDGTDPRRGAEVVEKLATQRNATWSSARCSATW